MSLLFKWVKSKWIKWVAHFSSVITSSMGIFLATSGSIQSNSSTVCRHWNWIFLTLVSFLFQSVEVQYFGASTLRIKISRYWNEVPPDEYVILRERLSSMLISYASGPKLVLTQLCLAVITNSNCSYPFHIHLWWLYIFFSYHQWFFTPFLIYGPVL